MGIVNAPCEEHMAILHLGGGQVFEQRVNH
jgi:hypothetical protein